ncbi:arabinan endo-1,5-alpha-L-arabinosidase [Thermostaphylospora chromogena]|uniref:Arabinan endo-1,5-alpha-L-arabinosidase n=2 Tax=Thermostaphylospora chromogena TaxID=35622 RepID=A0A1H1A654_9ACTN|nr:arabinan endo-1,5-alpha-L-arabinosidase [Thermostaphylospora chromogena]
MLAALSCVLASSLAAAPASAAPRRPGDGPLPVTGDVVVHDPTMIRARGDYLVYSTHGLIEARVSRDMKHFTRAGDAFTEPPAWWREYSPENDPWAPDISFHNGRYLLYYAVSSFGSNHSAIGLATSRTGLPGSWTDHGVVYATTTGDDHNAIDPDLLVDHEGRWWLSFGSHWTGIRMIRIDPATGKRHAGDRTLYHLATRPDAPYAVEAPIVVRRGAYYYLFASYDRCCAGVDSTYKIKVGRATSPTGPYVDRDGVPMLEGGGTVVLETEGSRIGPGGQDVVFDKGGHLLVHHYYDGEDGGTPKLALRRLAWDEAGWPYVR